MPNTENTPRATTLKAMLLKQLQQAEADGDVGTIADVITAIDDQEFIGIEDVRAWLRENYEHGCECPACGQNVELKERTISPAMARVLVAMDRHADADGAVNVNNLKEVRGGDYAKLRFWGLIEKVVEGRWRVTPKGRDFVHDRVRVPRVAYVYNNRARRFSDDDTNIRQVIGSQAQYEKLLTS